MTLGKLKEQVDKAIAQGARLDLPVKIDGGWGLLRDAIDARENRQGGIQFLITEGNDGTI